MCAKQPGLAGQISHAAVYLVALAIAIQPVDRARPAVGRKKPISSRNSVVLPAPLGPSRPTHFAAIDAETRS